MIEFMVEFMIQFNVDFQAKFNETEKAYGTDLAYKYVYENEFLPIKNKYLKEFANAMWALD